MNIKQRLKTVESALKPIAEKNMIIMISRAGREKEKPISWRNHDTGEVYGADDNLSHLKGYNVVMANYAD
jgi:hypothetical protein